MNKELLQAKSAEQLRKKFLERDYSKTIKGKTSVKEAWDPMKNHAVADAVEGAVSSGIENALYNSRTGQYKNFDDFMEAVEEGLSVDETNVIGLDFNAREDLAIYSDGVTGEGVPSGTKWEEIRGAMERASAQGLSYLAGEQAREMLSPIEDIIKREKLRWRDLAFSSDDPFGMFSPKAVDDVKGVDASKYMYRNVEGDVNADVYEISVGERGKDRIYITNHTPRR